MVGGLDGLGIVWEGGTSNFMAGSEMPMFLVFIDSTFKQRSVPRA